MRQQRVRERKKRLKLEKSTNGRQSVLLCNIVKASYIQNAIHKKLVGIQIAGTEESRIQTALSAAWRAKPAAHRTHPNRWKIHSSANFLCLHLAWAANMQHEDGGAFFVLAQRVLKCIGACATWGIWIETSLTYIHTYIRTYETFSNNNNNVVRDSLFWK